MKQRVRLEFRRRTTPLDDIGKLHGKLLAGLKRLPPSWWNPETAIDHPNTGEGLEAQVDLSPGFDGVTSYVAYVYRSNAYTRDTAEFDDRLILEFDASLEEYRDVAFSIFPELVLAFTPYRAGVVLDEDLALDDWDQASELAQSTGKDADGRDGIFRFPPICYFDHQLCDRAFRLSISEFKSQVQDCVEQIELLDGGVFFVASSDLLGREELIGLDRKLREAMGLPGSSD